MRRLAGLLVFGFALTICLHDIWDTCEKKCYAQKTNEPRDFDDCISRCQK